MPRPVSAPIQLEPSQLNACNAEVETLVSELAAAWTDPMEAKLHQMNRKLTKPAALDIVRRIGEGLPIARALEPWRINRQNIQAWEAKADEGVEPYATFIHYYARAQNVLRGKLLVDIANSDNIKAKIELLQSTTPEFLPPPPGETVVNLRPQFRGALEAPGRTVVNVLPELPAYKAPLPDIEDYDNASDGVTPTGGGPPVSGN